MIKRIFLQVFILAGCCLFFMGMEEAANVVAYRQMQQGNFNKALETYVKNNNQSGVGTVYCTLHMYNEALIAFHAYSDEV